MQVGISPGGVTTSLNAPAGATEQEYYQACHWARVWMMDKAGDPHDQIEPYLAMVQASANGENGTWNKPWATLTPEQQAGLIVAVKAAADGGCD
jgi:Putative lipoprotein LpqV